MARVRWPTGTFPQPAEDISPGTTPRNPPMRATPANLRGRRWRASPHETSLLEDLRPSSRSSRRVIPGDAPGPSDAVYGREGGFPLRGWGYGGRLRSDWDHPGHEPQ